ncbi:hypothetical protein TNCT_645061 [Trichonephila clavata]|uniref:Uncharacterized protein n=1 Tax=Trichonephila clavata TaxID=2740835 RepID=A0A8X6GR88_TRICU|nr:hypothetical protein TNCT_645061 [Trichonephila clavata]
MIKPHDGSFVELVTESPTGLDRMYREYKLRVASNRSTVEKAIELMIMEAHVRSAQPPLPGTVTIHTNLLQGM